MTLKRIVENETRMSEIHDFTLSIARDHLSELGLPPDFEMKLLKDDDWSLVIKLHAPLEAALTNALVAHVGEESTRELFARMNVGGGSGKLAFAKALKFADATEIRFVQALSELRNRLVHNVRNVNFRLKEHIKNLPVRDRRTFVRDLFYSYVLDERSTVSVDNAVQQVLARPKQALLQTGLQTIAIFYLQLRITKATHGSTTLKAKIAEAEHGRPAGSGDEPG